MDSSEMPGMASESVWLDANRFQEAESRYLEVSSVEQSKKANPSKVPSVQRSGPCPLSESSLVSEIAHARQKIHNFLKSGDSGSELGCSSFVNRLEKVEKEQGALKQTVEKLTTDMSDVLNKLARIEKILDNLPIEALDQSAKKSKQVKTDIQNGSSAAADDDDLDLFGSDEDDDDDTAKIKEERVQDYASRKAKKPALVAKSSVVLDIKPWDDETDLNLMEKIVRGIVPEGLVWGASKQVPLAYGIKKLQIVAIVEDEKVSVDWLQETICEIEDMVQSVDVAAFNKL